MTKKKKTNWMQSGSGSNSLGPLSNPEAKLRYQAVKMSDIERKRRTLFEDFRSRMISAAELKEELAALNG